ncbi:MAG: inositol monophosphatase [Acidimicrobiales bacterium]|jgi:3'(2'), 5'-bisphosphate nucleotidase|nr:inositol monophosphatase [Acidimicrobiales bacterium]
MNDHEFAATLADDVGAVLRTVRTEGLAGRELGDEGDRRAQQLIAERLRAERPADAVLSEEAADDKARLGAERVWIIDPLDGTREFREPPRSDWAVHVALLEHGRLTAGAVALPARSLVLRTPDVGSPPPPAGRRQIVVSRSRPPAFAAGVASALDADLVELGSAGAKAMAVVLGDADAYVHGGGQYEWDSAAPVAVALAAGLHCSRIDGSPLRYNQPDPYLPDLVVCRPELATRLLDAIAAEVEKGPS